MSEKPTHIRCKGQLTPLVIIEEKNLGRSRVKIPGYTRAACTESEVHGTATFVKHHARWSTIAVCPENSLLEWSVMEVECITIVNE